MVARRTINNIKGRVEAPAARGQTPDLTWATDNIFVAGGDFVSEFWAEFQDQSRVGAVVTVSPDRPGAYVDPAPWAALWLPVADEADYTLDQLGLGAQFIQTAIDAGYKVLLHGPRGVHRTRPLVAAHLLANGQSLARTLRDLEAKPWLPPYKGDVAVLEALQRWVTDQRITDRRTASG